ncbi:MAG TPA: DUF6340 family protein [Bacteroidales bacterium]|jgi:hypothetical protein|nr:DUF6340 family protein [Bacteroidales bacterium]
MNRKTFILVLSIIALLSAGACYNSYLTFSILQPADTVLPASLSKISILPMPGVPSVNGSFDSLENLKPGNPYDIKMGYIRGIHSVLSESPRFSRVKLTEQSAAPFIDHTQITWEDLANVCKHDSTDAVLVLSKAVSYSANSYNPYLIYNSSNFYLLNKTRWIFYQPQTHSVSGRFNYIDTVEFGEFPAGELSDLFYQACFITGENCGRRIVPYWQDVSRIIYSGPGRDLRDAAVFVKSNKWRNAGLLWNDLISHKKTKVASNAAFNLAVAFERDDDLEQAYLWISYADSMHHSSLYSNYMKILEIRLKNRSILIRQMTGK